MSKELQITPRQKVAEELAKKAIWPTIVECFKEEENISIFLSKFRIEVIALNRNTIRCYYQNSKSMYCKSVIIPRIKLWKASSDGNPMSAKKLCMILCEIAPTLNPNITGNIREGLEEEEKAVFDFYMNL